MDYDSSIFVRLHDCIRYRNLSFLDKPEKTVPKNAALRKFIRFTRLTLYEIKDLRNLRIKKFKTERFISRYYQSGNPFKLVFRCIVL